MENIIFFLGAAVLIIVIVLVIVLISSSNKKRKWRKQVEQYLMLGWDAIGKNDSVRARDSYNKIREAYKSKYDKKGQLMKRIKLFYSKLSEPTPQKK